MIYVAYSVGVVAWLGAAVYLVTIDHPWWAALCFLAAAAMGIESSKSNGDTTSKHAQKGGE